MKNNSKYTKKQIIESIEHWQQILESYDDNIAVEIIDDPDKIKILLPTVVDIVKNTYRPIGGYYGNTNIDKLSRSISLVKIVKNNDRDIASCAFYRNVNGGFKLQAYGNDGTQFGKDGVKAIVKSDVSPYTSWIWGEVSGAIEHYFKKFEGYPLPNEFVVEVLHKSPDDIELLDDGFHYRRKIGSNSNATEKVIYGFPNKEIADKAMSVAEYESKRTTLNMDLVNRKPEVNEVEENKLSFEGACSYVTQLSDLYDEQGWDQLTPGLSALLDQSIDVIRDNVNKAKWVQMTLNEALWLREHMPEITFVKNTL